MPYNLRPVWDSILEIYKVFAEICNKHNLRFYGAAGTALGAVRHKGFIPWDDDMDVIMPREDYDAVWEILDKELPPHLKTVTWRNTDGYTQLFGKIIDVRRAHQEEVARISNYEIPQGLFLDVFPLDGCYSSKLGRAWIKTKSIFPRCIANYKFPGENFHGWRVKLSQVIGFFAAPFYSITTKKDYLQLCDDLARRTFSLKSAKNCGWYFYGSGDYAEIVDKKVFDSVAYLDFESIKLPVPGDFDAYLTSIFGDYMTLPPESERVPVHGDSEPAPWRFGE